MPKSLKAIQYKYNHSDKGIERSRRQAEKRKVERAAARQVRIAAKAAKNAEQDQHWKDGQVHRDAYDAWLAKREEEDQRREEEPSEPKEETAFSKSQSAVLKQLLNNKP